MQIRKYALILIVLLMSLLVVPPALAQIEFSETVTFDPGTWIYEIVEGTLVSGEASADNDLKADCWVDGSTRHWYASVSINVPAGEIVEVAFETYWYNSYGPTQGLHVRILNASTAAVLVDEDLSGSYTEQAWVSHTAIATPFTCPAEGCDVVVESANSGTAGSTVCANLYHYVDNIEVTVDHPTDPWAGSVAGPFQPVSEFLQVDVQVPRNESDEITGFSLITTSPDESSILSMAGEVPVYAPVGSEVVNIMPYASGFEIELRAEIEGEFHRIDIRGLSLVYVQIGDMVDAECIIGLAGVQFKAVDVDETNLRQILYRFTNDDAGEILDWELHDTPSAKLICGSLIGNESCLNANPYLLYGATAWGLNPSTSGQTPIAALNGGVVLRGQSSIHQYIELQSGSDYYLTYGMTLLKDTALRINFTLGDVTESEHFTDIEPFGQHVGEMQVLTLGPLTPTTPDLLPDLYKLTIASQSPSAEFVINYACLHTVSDSPIANFSPCYFGALDDLDTTGESLADPLGTPYFALEDTETVSSAGILLEGYDDADAIYNVEVVARASATNADDDPATNANLVVSFDDGTEYADVNTYEIPASTFKFHLYTFRITIPEGESINADLVITHDQQLTTDSETISIASVCLYPIFGQWPGYDPAPEGDGNGVPGTGPRPGNTACAPVIAPLSTDVWEWVLWLFESLAHFFKCILPAELIKILNAILSIIELIGSIGRWLGAVFQLFGGWIFDLVGWLINTLVGLLAGIFELFWEAITGLPVLQWLFDLISLIGLVFSLITALLGTLLELVLLVVRTLGTFAQMIVIIAGYIWDGINGTTTVETGIPLCAALPTDDLFYPFCGLIDLVDYAFTLFPAFWGLVVLIVIMLAAATFEIARSMLRRTFSEVS